MTIYTTTGKKTKQKKVLLIRNILTDIFCATYMPLYVVFFGYSSTHTYCPHCRQAARVSYRVHA